MLLIFDVIWQKKYIKTNTNSQVMLQKAKGEREKKSRSKKKTKGKYYDSRCFVFTCIYKAREKPGL